MIGVLAAPAQHAAASEFFELFKTAWEFHQPSRTYDIVLSTTGEAPTHHPQLLLVATSRTTAFDQQRRLTVRPAVGAELRAEHLRLPLYGSAAALSGHAGVVATDADGSPLILAQGCEHGVWIRLGFDLFTEVAHLLEEGQPAEHAGIPTLDLHISLLRDLILNAGLALTEIPPVPAGHPFVLTLTHDVDHPTLRPHRCDHTAAGFLRRALVDSPVAAARGRLPWRKLGRNLVAAAQLPGVHLGLVRDWWLDFGRYATLEAGVGSTFFVIPRRGDPGRSLSGAGTAPAKRAAAYRVEDLRPQLDELERAGCEIALHGIDAWADVDQGRLEHAAVARPPPSGERGVRMHWLYFDAGAPVRLEAAGFSYDSTIGYNQTIGFRAGTTQVYRPPGCEHLLELPMHVMDTALFYPSYLNLTERQADAAIAPLLEHVARGGGTLTVNWHDRSLFPERLWGDAYIELLRRARAQGAWLTTAAATVAWFRSRRRASFPRDGGPAVLSGTAPAGLPPLRLRRHAPRSGLLRVPLTLALVGPFQDEPVPTASPAATGEPTERKSELAGS